VDVGALLEVEVVAAVELVAVVELAGKHREDLTFKYTHVEPGSQQVAPLHPRPPH
jgi:hypothetical protein